MSIFSRSVNGTAAFYWIVFGQLVSLLGSGLTSFALSVWVFRETGSALAYSVVLVFILLPVALGSFVAGPLVDRWDRRRILMITDTTSALLTLGLALLYHDDQLQLWHVYIALFIGGIATSFQIPAQQAIIPLLITKEKLGRAAGLSQLPGTVSEIFSPLLAGVLLVSIGLGGVFLIDMLTFIIGISTVFVVHIPAPIVTEKNTQSSRFRDEFTAGFRYLWINRPFLHLTGFITLTVFTLGAYYALYPPLILTLASEDVLGIVNALIGVGSLVGAGFLSLWQIKRRMRAIFVAAIVMSAGGIFAGVQTDLIGITIGLIAAFGSLPVLIGLNRVLYQLKAPPHLLGRIFAFRLAVGTTAQTIGALLAGLLAERVFEPIIIQSGEAGRGIALALIVTGGVFFAGTLLFAFIPTLRQLERRLPDYEPLATLAQSEPTPSPTD